MTLLNKSDHDPEHSSVKTVSQNITVRCRIKVRIESASCFSYVKEEKNMKK
jgi:hypothetical protein